MQGPVAAAVRMAGAPLRDPYFEQGEESGGGRGKGKAEEDSSLLYDGFATFEQENNAQPLHSPMLSRQCSAAVAQPPLPGIASPCTYLQVCLPPACTSVELASPSLVAPACFFSRYAEEAAEEEPKSYVFRSAKVG